MWCIMMVMYCVNAIYKNITKSGRIREKLKKLAGIITCLALVAALAAWGGDSKKGSKKQ